MRLKSFFPCRVPSLRLSTLATPSGSAASGGIFHAIQCVHVPTGASGSSAIRASDLVPAGAPAHVSPSERSDPSQVYFLGIVPPSENPVVLTENDMAWPPCDQRFNTMAENSRMIIATSWTLLLTLHPPIRWL